MEVRNVVFAHVFFYILYIVHTIQPIWMEIVHVGIIVDMKLYYRILLRCSQAEVVYGFFHKLFPHKLLPRAQNFEHRSNTSMSYDDNIW